jgi:hypothetical protein
MPPPNKRTQSSRNSAAKRWLKRDFVVIEDPMELFEPVVNITDENGVEKANPYLSTVDEDFCGNWTIMEDDEDDKKV